MNKEQNGNELYPVLAAVNFLYLMAGISDPTDKDDDLAMEAIVYANPDLWVDKPMTHKEYANRREFEIKSLSYFMRKRNYNDIKAIKFLEEYEQRELTALRAVISHPAFNYAQRTANTRSRA